MVVSVEPFCHLHCGACGAVALWVLCLVESSCHGEIALVAYDAVVV